MGTTVSLDVRDRGAEVELLERAVARLRELEARFTTYREDSEIRRLDRGELALADTHPEVHEVLAACEVLRAESDGAFDARREGRLDPSGYVKGWAGERAADLLREAGLRDFSIVLGGDVVCAGEREPGAPWRVGVRHPDDPGRMLVVLGIRDGAVATSGLYERGAHVVDARTGEVPTIWRSITVTAGSLATADAVATAALAMGEAGPEWAARRLGCGVAALHADGRLMTSPALEALRVA
jgi:thiamine biosynthesis lipoprotein